MAKRVILHVGFPKTGTTAIQTFCRTHCEALREIGLDYPELFVASDTGAAKPNHEALMTALLLSPPERLVSQKPRAIGLVDEAFSAFRSNAQTTLFLSHETISQRPDLDFARFRNWAEGVEVVVLAMVRTLDEWLESLYAQNLRSSKVLIRPFKEISLSRLEIISFLPRLRALQAGLPDASIKTLSFDRFRDGGLVEEVLRFVDADTPDLLSAAGAGGRWNPSRPAPEVMFGAYASLALNDPRMTAAVIAAFRKARKSGAAIPHFDRRFGFVPAEFKVLARERYRRDLPALRDEFGLDADDPGPLSEEQLAYSSSLTREEYGALYDAVAPYLKPQDAAAMLPVYDVAHERFAA